jgi:holin-like protein
MGILGALACLVGCQLLGDVAVGALGLPVPGPVAGMLLLFGALVLRGRVPDDLATTGRTLLRHLVLLLVPATTGVMLHVDRIGAEWLPIVLAGAGGAAATLVLTALTLRALAAHGGTSGDRG